MSPPYVVPKKTPNDNPMLVEFMREVQLIAICVFEFCMRHVSPQGAMTPDTGAGQLNL